MGKGIFTAVYMAWILANVILIAKIFFVRYREALERETAHCVCTVCGTAFDLKFSELPKMNFRKTKTKSVQVPGAGQSVTQVTEQKSRCLCPSCGTKQVCDVVNASEVSDKLRKEMYGLIVPRAIILVVGITALSLIGSVFGWN